MTPSIHLLVVSGGGKVVQEIRCRSDFVGETKMVCTARSRVHSNKTSSHTHITETKELGVDVTSDSNKLEREQAPTFAQLQILILEYEYVLIISKGHNFGHHLRFGGSLFFRVFACAGNVALDLLGSGNNHLLLQGEVQFCLYCRNCRRK